MTFAYNTVQSDMTSIYEMSVKDLEDVIYSTKRVHEWANTRNDQFSGMVAFAEMLNEFGERGGFETIIAVLEDIADGKYTPTLIDKDNKQKPDFGYLTTLQSILLKTLPLQTRQFCCRWVHMIEKAYLDAITAQNSTVQHTFNINDINSLAVSYEELLQRNYTKKKFEHKST